MERRARKMEHDLGVATREVVSMVYENFMANANPNCFAFNGTPELRCKALGNIYAYCPGCKFYKTTEQHEADKAAAEARLLRSGRADMAEALGRGQTCFRVPGVICVKTSVMKCYKCKYSR